MIPTLFIAACLLAAPHSCPLEEWHYHRLSQCRQDRAPKVAWLRQHGYKVTMVICIKEAKPHD